jgi:tetratricopeptide (TPR) repeat protein
MLDKASITRSAKKFTEKGQIDQAIEEWEKLLKESPDGNIYNSIGDLYLRKSLKFDAIQCFIKAANIFRDDGFYLKAIALYKKILNISPLETDALVALAELNAEKGLLGIANDNFLTAAEEFIRKEATHEALNHYQKILGIAPANLGLKIKMAQLFLKKNLKTKAAKEYLSIAQDYREKQEHEKAQEYYAKAIDLEPENVEAFMGLSGIEEDKNNIHEAYEYLNKALLHAPDRSDLLFQHARLAVETNNIDNAKKTLTKLLEQEPSNNQYRKLLGSISLKEGSLEKAWEELLPYIDDILHTDKYSEALELLNNFENTETVAVKQRVISIYKEKNDKQALTGALKELAEIFENRQLHQESLRTYQELQELDPSDLMIIEKITELSKTLGIPPETHSKTSAEEPQVTIADTTSPDKKPQDDLDEIIAEADFYAQQGLTADAIKIYEKFLSTNPDNKEIRQKLESLKPVQSPDTKVNIENFKETIAEADFYAQQGLANDAIKLYKKLLTMTPDSVEIKQKLEALQSVDKPGGQSAEEKIEVKLPLSEEQNTETAQGESEAINTFDKFKKGLDEKLGDKDYESHYNLGIAYKEMGLIDDAIREFLIAAKDPQKTIQTASMLAACYIDKKLYPLAIKELKKAVGVLSPTDEGYLDTKMNLAETLEKNSEYTEALQTYTDIQSKNPDFKDIKQKVEHIQSLISEETKGKPKSKKDRVSYL